MSICSGQGVGWQDTEDQGQGVRARWSEEGNSGRATSLVEMWRKDTRRMNSGVLDWNEQYQGTQSFR